MRLGVQRQPHLHGSSRLNAVKLWRAYPNNGKGDAVHSNLPPYDRGIAAKSPLPIAIADYRHRTRTGSVIARTEGAAENRLNAQRRKECSGDKLAIRPRVLRFVADIQLTSIRRDRQHAGEDPIPGANLFVGWVGKARARHPPALIVVHLGRQRMQDAVRPTVRCPVEQHKLLRILNGQHREQHRVNEAEDGRVGPNAERHG